jgi:molybdopterin-guanine dinucleotide biosynthesis protein A
VLRVAEELAKVCGSVAVVGDPVQYEFSGLPVVPDSYLGAGPLAGIEAALGATSTEANLIVACDMPLLRAEVFEELFAAEGDCAVPRYADGKIEPLCAVYSVRCRERIREMLESGVRAVNEALRLLESGGFAIRYLQVPTSDTFANLNTPEDLARFRQENRRG